MFICFNKLLIANYLFKSDNFVPSISSLYSLPKFYIDRWKYFFFMNISVIKFHGYIEIYRENIDKNFHKKKKWNENW